MLTHETRNVPGAGSLIRLCVLLSGLIAAPLHSQAAEVGEFHLAPGDTVRLDILDDEKEPVDLLVATDGTIQAPFLGAVKIEGMTVAAARDEIKRQYIEEQFFLHPRLGLSVAQYRPVYVIGDVRTPGSYPFEWKLTVEKAMGLAGGQILATPGEDPVLLRARIRGDLDTIRAEIIREGLALARLSAQLDDRSTIEPNDMPPSVQPYMEGATADTLLTIEQRILTEEVEGYQAERKGLEELISESQNGIELLQELFEKLNVAMEFSREDLKRAQELQKRGIQTLSGVSNIERQLTMEEARQLQVLSDMSAERRGISTLKRQLAELSHTRKVKALNDLQSHHNKLMGALASRRAAEEQLVLLSSMAAEERANQNKEVVLDYTIRREIDGQVSNVQAAPNTSMQPGDVLVVRIRGEGSDLASVRDTPSTAAQ